MAARETLFQLLHSDLVGPAGAEDEILERARPSDRYVTGILYPRLEDEAGKEISVEEDDDRDTADDDSEGSDQPVPMDAIRRPPSMGVSLFVEGEAIAIRGSAARYQQRWRTTSGEVTETNLGRANEIWLRQALQFEQIVTIEDGLRTLPTEIAGLRWWIRVLGSGAARQVTVILENVLTPGPARVDVEMSSFFQVQFQVEPCKEGRFVARRPRREVTDEDGAINELIYRSVKEYAIGHVCSATWSQDGRLVETSWLPSQNVPSMSPLGHAYFREEGQRLRPQGDAFDARTLADASDDELPQLLATIPLAYRRWITDTENKIVAAALSSEQEALARRNMQRAGECAGRLEQAIELLRADPVARRAYRASHSAMLLQRQWSEDDPSARMIWRPFQLAFQLLGLSGLVRPLAENGGASDERLMMDLLWFPTGGGKTEAYLGLIAFLLFHRRLRQAGNPDDGAGVAALMRYTLRLLTVQQFERAARMVLACDLIRRQAAEHDNSLGSVPFSIGLWVGQDATPNTIEKARTPDGRRKARQLTRCPCCRQSSLNWDAEPARDYVVHCMNSGCAFFGVDLPIYTIDELLYRHRPSLVIGTVDKFAQLCRRAETGNLLGADVGEPPDLILQDELHLISGPLGTVVGVYEAAIDRICARLGVPPKVVGSTATIRRAEQQVLRLFNREVFQFPPPVLDWSDSCFAVLDEEVPGRVYVGITTVGRSPKFTLQAVCASLLQRANEPAWTDEERDPFWTLLTYFNSMRELGGAHVMMLDDVNDSMRIYARSPAVRRPAVQELLELTSRVSSEDIPEILERLDRPYPRQDVSVVLATNMISVGVDIPRLGLMVVNGQPKSMAEYIQATSRVGRGSVPGLIVTVYNAGRSRDRAHYESFRTWHQALYRDVEATSVTPFAARARDKALHAAIVALARHLVPGLRNDPPTLTPVLRDQLEEFVRSLEERARAVEPGEADAAAAEAADFLDRWERRGPLRTYWVDRRPRSSLLVSAEYAAARVASTGEWTGPAQPTPNTMREVEPSVRLRLVSGLTGGRARGGQQ
jgi:hypothetical protein